MAGGSRPVYSTEHGRLCPECGAPVAACTCRTAAPVRKGDGIVRVALDTKGRKGKGVTLVTGADLEPAALVQLATRLKQRCGAGGTVKDGAIEIQGDHRDVLVDELGRQGFKVRRIGG